MWSQEGHDPTDDAGKKRSVSLSLSLSPRPPPSFLIIVSYLDNDSINTTDPRPHQEENWTEPNHLLLSLSQKDYKANGWLGLILGTRLCVLQL